MRSAKVSLLFALTLRHCVTNGKSTRERKNKREKMLVASFRISSSSSKNLNLQGEEECYILLSLLF